MYNIPLKSLNSSKTLLNDVDIHVIYFKLQYFPFSFCFIRPFFPFLTFIFSIFQSMGGEEAVTEEVVEVSSDKKKKKKKDKDV